jgi:hypothetical protein
MMNLFNNPANKAQSYLNQIPGTITPYYQPYINAGTQDLGSLQQQLQMLINNPGGMMNKMGAGYQQSPGYQFNVEQATNAANQASAAGGMVGSPQEQQQLATTVTGLANQDYYNYLDHILNMYGMGMKGLGGVAKGGYMASNELAQSLANNLMSQAGLAYSGAANTNQAIGNALGFGGSNIQNAGKAAPFMF